MQITAIFDLDGTLADTLEDLADATNYSLKALGYPVHPYESYKMFVGNGVPKLCFRALPDEHKDDTEKLIKIFSEYYNEHFLDKTKLYPGIYDMMKRLDEKGIIFAVATNKPQNFAVKIVEKLLSEFRFTKILGGCNEREKKPDPAIIREILGDSYDHDSAFMIGDSNVDILTAQNSGIRSIGCAWGFRGEAELTRAGADFIAITADDVADHILKCL